MEYVSVPTDIPDEQTPLLEVYDQIGPKSTFTQTTVNSLNLLMGMGLLSLPFAFYKLGWVLGLSLLVFFCVLACYTAYLIGKCMGFETGVGKLSSFYDIAYMAYGAPGKYFMVVLFSLELLAAAVAMLILFADSLISLVPVLTPFKPQIMIGSILLLTPLTWQKSMSKISWVSFVGVLSLIVLTVAILWDGITSPVGPGSIFDPQQTNMWPEDINQVGLGIGLLFVGLDGHAVFPSLYLDMIEKKRFGKSVSITYTIVAMFYSLIGACGYLMFGNEIQPEVSQNLPLVPSFNVLLNQSALSFIAINPLTKYALIVHPVNSTIEGLFNIYSDTLTILSRTFLSFLVLLIAIIFPSFYKVMGFIGAALSFMTVVIMPTACYIRLSWDSVSWWSRFAHLCIIVFGFGFMTFGTYGVMTV
ncbi:hypothetical protein HDV04_005489 [Boothiomyces sp. JEL0838]|nr:hypothetical protein HDV04_005489 [Boothiomyces sp. JEL0838]